MSAQSGILAQVPDAKSDLPSVDRLVYLISGAFRTTTSGFGGGRVEIDTLAPPAPLDEKIRRARHAVSSLLGHNDLWRGDWPGGPIAFLTEDEMGLLAHDDVPWHDPEHATLLVWIREEGATRALVPSSPLIGYVRPSLAPALNTAIARGPAEVFALNQKSSPPHSPLTLVTKGVTSEVTQEASCA